MTFIGFQVSKEERAELARITRDMAVTPFKHPQTGQEIRFLPPGAGIGTLVKMATSEYIRYFMALKNGGLPQPQQQSTAEIAQAAVKQSMAMRTASGPGGH